MEKMDEYRLARRVLMADVSGYEVPGKAGWMTCRWPCEAEG